MIRSFVMTAVCFGWLGAGGASAEVLTCAAFAARLDQALGSLDATPATKPSFDSVRDGGAKVRQIPWTGPGLAGRLTCGEKDAFADFYMAVTPAARPSAEIPPDLAGFKDLGAASICALSAGPPSACRSMMTRMTEEGVANYRDDLAQHDDRPQGLIDYDLFPNLDAVFYLTPRALSWAVGPGIYATIDAARPALAPKDRDDEDE